jgi:site-specific DNA recombinase
MHAPCQGGWYDSRYHAPQIYPGGFRSFCTHISVDDSKGRVHTESMNNPSGAKTKAVIYVRVSTDKQAESGLSLEAQRARCIQYASLYDIDVVDIVADTQSAKDLERPGLNQVQEHLKNGTANAVLVTDLDRLTRSVEDGVALVKKWFSEESDYILLSVFDHLDTRSPEGEFMLTVKLALAQLERKKIGKRTKIALEEKRVQLAAIGEALGPKPVEKLVPEVVRIVLDARNRGLSVREICDDLNRDKIPTARGGGWHPTSVQRLLKRLKPEDESQGKA